MNNNTIDSNLLRQIFFIAVIIFLGIVLFRELWFFTSAFLGAVTFYVVMRDRMFYLTKKKMGAGAAAWILMLLSFFVILVPIGLLGNIMYSKVSYMVTHSAEMINSLKIATDQISKKIGFQIIDPGTVSKLGNYIAELLPKILNITFNTLTLISSMYFILYFMLVNGRKMEEALYEYIPLKDGNVELLGRESRTIIMSNAIGIPLIALIQGVVALIGYLIIGVDEPFLWFVATSIAAMLPVVGASLIYGPLTIWLFVQGRNGKRHCACDLGLWYCRAR